MLDQSESKPVRLNRRVVHESRWVNHYIDRVQFPAGRIVEEHHILDFETEAAAAIVENKNKEILMVQVYRYATDRIEWEIPAGGMDKGESILEAAKRETHEETGYDTVDHELIYTYYPMNGMANKVFHIVKCRALNSSGEFDRNEIKTYQWVSPKKIKHMIANQTFKDGYTLTALLLHLLSGSNP